MRGCSTTWRASSRSRGSRRRRSRTWRGRSSSTRACGQGRRRTPTSTRSGRTRASRRSSARLARGLDLYEYQGKELFRRAGIPGSEGRLATSPEEARAAAQELGGQVVVKAQVLAGGRGKAGGVKLAEDPADAEQKAKDIIGLDIRGHVVETLWIEQASDI